MGQIVADLSWLNAPELQKLFRLLGPKDCRVVGGAVREALLGRTPQEIDLCTRHEPQAVIERLESAQVKTFPIGLEHGSVLAVLKDETGKNRSFEITTLRRDVACDGRHARVTYTNSFREDAARRDFTINALMLNSKGQLYDFFSGKDDLMHGRLRFIGRASQRIEEDLLRVWRFFRFYAAFNGLKPDKDTKNALAEGARQASRLSGERLREEARRMLIGESSKGIILMLELGVANELFLRKTLNHEGWERYHKLAKGKGLDWRLALYILLDGDAAALSHLVKRWKLSRNDRLFLLSLPVPPAPDAPDFEPANLPQTLYRLGPERVRAALWQKAVARNSPDPLRALKKVQRYERPRFPLTGKDLLALGLPEGPGIGRTLKALEVKWFEANFRGSRKDWLKRVQKLIQGQEES